MSAYYETPSFKYFDSLRQSLKADRSVKLKSLDTIECLRALKLDRFVDVIDRGGMIDEIRNLPAVTVFAPTNDAFDALSEDDKKRMLGSASACRTLVQDHTVLGFMKIYGNTNDKVQLHDVGNFHIEHRTLLGNQAVIAHRYYPQPEIVYLLKAETNVNATAVKLYATETANGYIQVIDAVLGSSEERGILEFLTPEKDVWREKELVPRHVTIEA